MKLIIFVFIFISSFSVFAAKSGGQAANWLGIAQGTSNPTQTSTLNFSNGYLSENPVGVIYQQGIRLTAQGDHGDTTTGLGGEVGLGDGKYGIAVGYYNRDCESCDGNLVGSLGFSLADIGIGVRFAENIYALGLIFDTYGKHRFGLMAELADPDGDDNNIQTVGLGYSYNGDRVTFSVDGSKRDFQSATGYDNTILVTPGVAVHFSQLSVSLSYNHYIDEDPDTTVDNRDLWFGVGFGNKTDWYVALYHDYVNEWSASASFYF